jgi:hypothetical protein
MHWDALCRAHCYSSRPLRDYPELENLSKDKIKWHLSYEK